MMNDARATMDDLVKNPPERSLKDRTVEDDDVASDSASESEASEASEASEEDSEVRTGSQQQSSRIARLRD